LKCPAAQWNEVRIPQFQLARLLLRINQSGCFRAILTGKADSAVDYGEKMITVAKLSGKRLCLAEQKQNCTAKCVVIWVEP